MRKLADMSWGHSTTCGKVCMGSTETHSVQWVWLPTMWVSKLGSTSSDPANLQMSPEPSSLPDFNVMREPEHHYPAIPLLNSSSTEISKVINICVFLTPILIQSIYSNPSILPFYFLLFSCSIKWNQVVYRMSCHLSLSINFLIVSFNLSFVLFVSWKWKSAPEPWFWLSIFLARILCRWSFVHKMMSIQEVPNV